MDVSQFHATFFEEANEHLESLESLLLSLDLSAPDPEQLNAIFRAAHSIKGGAATFGFRDVANLTHALETLLDRLRKQELLPTQEMVDALLAGGDVLRSQLAAHRGQGSADEAAAEAVRVRIERLAEIESAPVAPAVIDLPEPLLRRAIRFRAALTQEVVDNLLGELRALGTLEVLTEPARALGKNGKRKGAWVLSLTARAQATELEELLQFVVQPEELEVGDGEPAPSAAASVEDAGFGLFEDVPGTPAADPGYGFFTELPASEQVQAQGYGFFDTAPGVPQAAAPAPADKTPASAAPPAKVVPMTGNESSSIRVSVEKVDQLINLVGELVITQAMLAQTSLQLDPTQHGRLSEGMEQLERNTRDLQEAVMSIRMLPIAFVFSRFPRLVRDLASKLGKRVELKTVGEGTELDKGVIEKIADPLTHLVRNSLDHGIESPADRRAAGKPETGTITLRAFHQGGSIVIEVADDGGGLHRQRILDKARSRGMQVADDMPDQDVWQLIFEPGFSTAEVVSDVSGRGVGMDVVKRNIQAAGGRVDLSSAPGQGTRISIRLPLTLAILDGMSIAVGKEIFIVPLGFVVESLQPKPQDIRTISGECITVKVRGDYLPVVPLAKLFNLPSEVVDPASGILVILETEGARVALAVDELVGQHQIVIKSLEANYRRVPGISGATIMGDGKVALILDAAALVRSSRNLSLIAA